MKRKLKRRGRKVGRNKRLPTTITRLRKIDLDKAKALAKVSGKSITQILSELINGGSNYVTLKR